MKRSSQRLIPRFAASPVSFWRGPFGAAGLSMAVAVGVAGCGRSEAATSRERPSNVAGDGAPTAHVETDTYSLDIKAAGPYALNAEGNFTVSLETKGDFHINEQYPYKFTPKAGTDGVTYKGPAGREAGRFDKTHAVLTIPFTPTKAGALPVGGKLSLSVCSDKNCLLDRQDLETNVTVK